MVEPLREGGVKRHEPKTGFEPLSSRECEGGRLPGP